MSPEDEQGYTDYDDTGRTRMRLPERDTYGGAPHRPGRSSSRSLVTVVGVVVLLIAAIAFANRGDHHSSADGSSTDGSPAKGSRPQTSSTAPSGKRPVDTKASGIPTGFAHTEQGAESAAANYAMILGSDGMFNGDRRHQIVQTIADSSTVASLQSGFDADYSAAFMKKIGLSNDGSAPKRSTFVNRTMPVGTKVTSYSDGAASVEVWCNGLFGLAGDSSTNPVTSSWFTVTMKLRWNDDWKVLETTQKTGPTPVTGDNPVSGADEISKAVQEFGGFTYAR